MSEDTLLNRIKLSADHLMCRTLTTVIENACIKSNKAEEVKPLFKGVCDYIDDTGV